MPYVIKAEVRDIDATTFTFDSQKTMYGGRKVAPGDTIFIFASESEGGPGLIARGVVIASAAIAKNPALERQTPRVSVSIDCTARAARRLGRGELKPFCRWDDGRPETELNFRLYRQATNKIVGISDATAAFLDLFFEPRRRSRP